MINISQEITNLKDILEKNINGYAKFDGNKKELLTLCPKCESDKYFKNPKASHLYISVESLIFNCFKCGFSGFINKLLREYGLNAKDIFGELDFSKLKKNEYKVITDTDDRQYYIQNKDVLNKDEKIKYLNYRCPYIDDVESLNGLILDLKSFIKDNQIKLDNSNFEEYLCKNFVGFITNRKTQVVCRNIDINNEFRHYKLHLGKHIFFKDFYGTELLKQNMNDINNIALCEGVFDLINIYSRPECKQLIKNVNYIACGLNNQYYNTYISVMDNLKLNKSNVIIFSDSNVELDNYKPMRYNNCINNLRIYYNELDKDFAEKDCKPILKNFPKYIKNDQDKKIVQK